ncbi:MAG: AP endonuclease [Hyphomicrobiales bacterium]|nr:MAG: AP endonuclease [Hyphomicrobiales bacterium]
MRRHRTFSLLLRLALPAALAALGAAIAFGYLGRLHLAFDSFSHLRLHLAALLLLLVPALLVLRLRIEAAFAALLGLAVTIQTVGPHAMPSLAGADAGPTYRLLQMNLRYDNPTPEAALSLIGAVRPDVMTLSEVSDLWREKLALLEAAYPYRLICPQPSHVGGAAILSRRPFAEGFEPRCGDRGSFAHVRLDLGGRTVEVAALHMGWPWPFEQPWQLPRLAPLLGGVGDTAIVAGDLNAVPWSHAARRIAEASGARILRGVGPTWLDRRLPPSWRRLVGLPIDNLMVKGGVRPTGLATLESPGSDHTPVLLEFVVEAGEIEKRIVSSE